MSVASAVQWRKEVRELLPWWAAIVSMMAACWALMHPDAMPFDSAYSWAVVQDRDTLLGAGLIAYVAGTITLGALSIGHEYSHHTLAQLLAQPVQRSQVLRVKLVVLAAMLLPLGLLAVGAWGAEYALVGTNPMRLMVVPLLGGLFVAPWLTMVGRGPLAGVVFTLALFTMLVVTTSLYPPTWEFWFAVTALAGIGAVMTWRMFLRLEAAGGPQGEVDFAGWISRPSEDTLAKLGQRPWWLLVKKELRLQQATFVMSGLFVAVWSIVVGRQWLGMAGSDETPLVVVTFLNAFLVPLLAGAVASAEERRLGAAEWQTLLPVAAWKQWIIKASVAVGVTIALAAVLPSSLASIAAVPGMMGGPETMKVALFCVMAIYVSSITTTGLRAFLITGPAVAVALLIETEVLWPIVRTAQPAIRWLVQALPVVKIPDVSYVRWTGYDMELAFAGLALLLLRFGLSNHRSADRGLARIARQIGWILAYATAATLLISFVGQLVIHWILATQGR